MADKYASKRTRNREEDAARIMMARRMSGAEADRYAAALAKAGVLESGDQMMAVAVLHEYMSGSRAKAIVKDLVDYGAMEAKQ
jgi:spore maturation protein SpmB